ncbi:hypothetical protein, partial [Mesorhizobium sp. M2A.F.Ca.ET.029.05.1.1]
PCRSASDSLAPVCVVGMRGPPIGGTVFLMGVCTVLGQLSITVTARPAPTAKRSSRIVEQFDVAFSEQDWFVAESDFDAVFDLHQKRFRPMYRHGRDRR